jgi:hypothetical protein
MEEKKKKFDTFFQFHYDQRKKKWQTVKKNCAVYGPNTEPNLTEKRQFQRFCSGNTDVKDERHFDGQSSKISIKSWKYSSQIGMQARISLLKN